MDVKELVSSETLDGVGVFVVGGVPERDNVAVCVKYEGVYAGWAEAVGRDEEIILVSMRGKPTVAGPRRLRRLASALQPGCSKPDSRLERERQSRTPDMVPPIRTPPIWCKNLLQIR